MSSFRELSNSKNSGLFLRVCSSIYPKKQQQQKQMIWVARSMKFITVFSNSGTIYPFEKQMEIKSDVVKRALNTASFPSLGCPKTPQRGVWRCHADG